MASFSECWGQLKAKGYKHANGKEVLTDNDKQSILDRTETFKKEDGLSHGDAIRKSLQEHHDEAHAQVQSIHDQLGIKPTALEIPPVPKVETPVTSEPIQKESGTVETPPTEPPTVEEKVQPGQFEKKGYTAVPTKTESAISDEQHVSTIANRFTEERTKSGELGEIAPGQGYSTRELADAGLKMTPEQINQHVSDLMNGTGDPIEQGKAVRAEEARLSQRSNELSRVASADPTNIEARTAADNAFKDVTDFHNGPVAKLKTIFHATGVGLQGELPVDLSTFNGLREKFLRDTGKPPTPEQEPQLRAMAEKVIKSVAEDNGAKQSLGQAIDKATARRKLPTYDEVRQNIADRMKIEPCRT